MSRVLDSRKAQTASVINKNDASSEFTGEEIFKTDQMNCVPLYIYIN